MLNFVDVQASCSHVRGKEQTLLVSSKPKGAGTMDQAHVYTTTPTLYFVTGPHDYCTMSRFTFPLHSIYLQWKATVQTFE